jgi:hypothetical protein
MYREDQRLKMMFAGGSTAAVRAKLHQPRRGVAGDGESHTRPYRGARFVRLCQHPRT